MIVERSETWGIVRYDTSTHTFSTGVERDIQEEPYVSLPVLLNVDLTFRCNMNCVHCVAKDMATILGGMSDADLRVTSELIDSINRSPFMAVVITGGEPLLDEVRPSLVDLLTGLEEKGIIVDTNGTLLPSATLMNLLREKQVMLRVSWDSPNPRNECALRKYPRGMYNGLTDYMEQKEKLIQVLVGEGLSVAVQTVLHGKNFNDKGLVRRFPHKLRQLGVCSWYIQRFIPSHKKKDDPRYVLEYSKYEWATVRIARNAAKQGIMCAAKRDRRHNSVFLLVKEGKVYTQSGRIPGGKVYLGNLADMDQFFEFVSSSEHSARYIPQPPDS
jgi:MoaA/NifB/PqqE/SkfB family radical SAM enzyme